MTRVARLLLVRHSTSADTRAARFPRTTGASAAEGCAPLDAEGVTLAAALGDHLPAADRVWSSHAQRAQQTAAAAGLDADALAVLAEADFGRWAGSTLAEIHAAEPDTLAAWWADPATPVHDGESLAALRERAAWLLQRCVELGGTTIAITHGGLIRACVLEATGLDDRALWAIDVAPASVTDLRGGTRDAGAWWRVARLNWTPTLDGRVAA